jgi:hypothetical protein
MEAWTWPLHWTRPRKTASRSRLTTVKNTILMVDARSVPPVTTFHLKTVLVSFLRNQRSLSAKFTRMSPLVPNVKTGST